MGMASALVLLPLLLPQVALCAANPVHMPLFRRAGTNTLQHFLANAERARARYGFQANSSRAGRRRATSQGFQLTDEGQDLSYFTTVSIGTPPQPLNIDLDTGSADLFVIDNACIGCSDGKLFDRSRSSTFSQQADAQTLELDFGSGSVFGVAASDTVSMQSFTVSKQIFVTADDATTGFIQGTASGILGLAFQSIAETRAVPFWQALINDNQLSAPEMSFHLARAPSLADAPGGTFTLGGTDTAAFTGSIEFHDLAEVEGGPMFWMLRVSGATVQGKSVSISTGNAALAAIDTGTTGIGGPTADVARIWNAVPGASPFRGDGLPPGFFQFPCSTQVSVTLSFGGQAWAINPDDMNRGQIEEGSSLCIGALFDLTLTGSGEPSWVIGDAFLKNVYSVFRQNPLSVGFAQLSGAIGGGGGGNTPGPTSTSSPGESGINGFIPPTMPFSQPFPSATPPHPGPSSTASPSFGDAARTMVAPTVAVISAILAVVVTVL
ncbi:aspartyl protease [Mycena pura]|uniref:Aspartyl protease n=1 Tax=Mycena pura TaxID=153505 RepID=A0AAD6V7A1_9AGAR|nr:aspartyl protease [Mycena pura]